MPDAFPRLRCDKVLRTFLGVKQTLRLVPPVRVERRALMHPLLSDGGCKFSSMWKLVSLIFATGACFVILTLADLKLSKSAANCAALCVLTGLSDCCFGDLLTTNRDSHIIPVVCLV